MPKTISPIDRRKKLIEDFSRQKTQKAIHCKTEFEPIKRFTNERAVKEFDKWYSSSKGGTSLEK